eukprot:3238391-Rhodomonas_salina.2
MEGAFFEEAQREWEIRRLGRSEVREGIGTEEFRAAVHVLVMRPATGRGGGRDGQGGEGEGGREGGREEEEGEAFEWDKEGFGFPPAKDYGI